MKVLIVAAALASLTAGFMPTFLAAQVGSEAGDCNLSLETLYCQPGEEDTIKSALSNGNKKIVLSAGTFNVGYWSIKSSTEISGQGPDQTVLVKSPGNTHKPFLQAGTREPDPMNPTRCIEHGNPSGSQCQVHDIKISNLKISGLNNASASIGIVIFNGERIEVSNVHFENIDHDALSFYGSYVQADADSFKLRDDALNCRVLTITDNKFESVRGHGISLATFCQDFVISGNKLVNINKSGINCSNSIQAEISHNDIYHQGDDPGHPMGHAGIRLSNNAQNISVKENRIQGMSRGIFVLTSSHYNNIGDNYIRGVTRSDDHQYRPDGVKHVSQGIYVTSPYNTIFCNDVGNTDGRGIVVSGRDWEASYREWGGYWHGDYNAFRNNRVYNTGIRMSLGKPTDVVWILDTPGSAPETANKAYGTLLLDNFDGGKWDERFSWCDINSYETRVRLLESLIPKDGDFYVAPWGSDSNPGTFSEPFASVYKAQFSASPGDLIYIRGGTYKFSGTSDSDGIGILFGRSGQRDQPIKYFAYPGETPVFDFFDFKPYARIRGFSVQADWLHFKGIEIKGVQQVITDVNESWGIRIENNADHNIFENMNLHHNEGPGLFIASGGDNLVLNVDSHHNYDPDRSGENADGFVCHSTRDNNIFYGSRAWANSDDGFDFMNSLGKCIVEYSFAFNNGYIPDTTTNAGDGTGFKIGGFGLDTSKFPSTIPRHESRFNVAFGNRINGFYSNHHPGGLAFVNNTAFNNQYNFNLLADVGSADHYLRNNVAFGSGAAVGNANTSEIDSEYNSWDLAVTANVYDFKSIESHLATAPRDSDGSLPINDFVRLVSGSDLIDAGENIGDPFLGSAPDLGAFEY